MNEKNEKKKNDFTFFICSQKVPEVTKNNKDQHFFQLYTKNEEYYQEDFLSICHKAC